MAERHTEQASKKRAKGGKAHQDDRENAAPGSNPIAAALNFDDRFDDMRIESTLPLQPTPTESVLGTLTYLISTGAKVSLSTLSRHTGWADKSCRTVSRPCCRNSSII
jgi:hypothetical protein